MVLSSPLAGSPEVEPSEVEPSEVEPSEVEPSEVEPSEVEPSEVEPSEVEPSEVEPLVLPTAPGRSLGGSLSSSPAMAVSVLALPPPEKSPALHAQMPPPITSPASDTPITQPTQPDLRRGSWGRDSSSEKVRSLVVQLCSEGPSRGSSSVDQVAPSATPGPVPGFWFCGWPESVGASAGLTWPGAATTVPP